MNTSNSLPSAYATSGAQTRTPVACRPADTVMRLSRLGAFHQSRLSFMRVFTRRLVRERWRYERQHFAIDAEGVGYAVYTLHGPARAYSLVAFSHKLADEDRSDRVIAEAWDATFALFDGIPDKNDLARLSENVPGQEAGRLSERELSLSRANRSMRMWQHVVSSLAAGKQPELSQLLEVGYLMRTTAVYGSGKFGAADRQSIASRPEFAEPFQVEMLSVYLTRGFVVDLVEHMARAQAPEKATTLAPDIARQLGIGNSTGLGMAPFIINHPTLFNNWISAREQALQRVRSVAKASTTELALFAELLERTRLSVSRWRTDHPRQSLRIAELADDLALLANKTERFNTPPGASQSDPWDALYRWGEQSLGIEAQECLVSLMLEPYAHLVDELSASMSCAEPSAPHIDGSVSVASMRAAMERCYAWALSIDWQQPASRARAWYVSQEKLEPRLGERYAEALDAYEQPLGPGEDAAKLYRTLASWDDEQSIAALLVRHPEHRHTVRRVQTAARLPYAEIRDNTIDAEMQPIDMLRCKLSFLGATQFDPRSDRWLRICLFAGAPCPSELANTCGIEADQWIYPTLQA